MRDLTKFEKDVLRLARDIIEDAYEGDIFQADINSLEYKVFSEITDIIYEQNLRKYGSN